MCQRRTGRTCKVRTNREFPVGILCRLVQHTTIMPTRSATLKGTNMEATKPDLLTRISQTLGRIAFVLLASAAMIALVLFTTTGVLYAFGLLVAAWRSIAA